ncbi:MAG: hypothetical protein HQK60_08705 [Deltaproteobacteria bacterium]|nr:hypothetical protein [Deltaproteobacteria bacterium]
MLQELNQTLLFAEDNWFNVSEGLFSKEEIHTALMKLKTEKTNSSTKYLKNSILPFKKKFQIQAVQQAKVYFAAYDLDENLE